MAKTRMGRGNERSGGNIGWREGDGGRGGDDRRARLSTENVTGPKENKTRGTNARHHLINRKMS